MDKWRDYLREVFESAFLRWDRANTMSALGGAVFAIPVALLAMGGISVYLKPEAQQLPALGIGLWFIFLLTFVAPYKVWTHQRQIIRKFEEAQLPKLSITPQRLIKGDPNAHDAEWRLEVKVKNVSGVTIRSAVVHIELEDFSGNRFWDMPLSIPRRLGGLDRIDIDPQQEKFYQVATLNRAIPNQIKFHHNAPHHFPTKKDMAPSEELKVRITVNSTNNPPQVHEFWISCEDGALKWAKEST